jgi:hypothetical protein
MRGELVSGTYRANGDLIHRYHDLSGRPRVEVEHRDGSRSWVDAGILSNAVRLSMIRIWPVRTLRLTGIVRLD